MFGAGYAGAQDRLFLMDVLRHTGRAELASFLGGSNAAADASQWQFAPYTEADLEKQIKQMPKLYGKDGQQAVEDLDAYVEGINAYVAAASYQPAAETGRIHAAEPADGTVEADRHHRDRLAGRRHLRPRRRQRAELGADDGGDGRTDGQEGRTGGLARLPLEERPGSADDDRKAVPLRDPQRLRQARAGAARTEQRARRKSGQRLGRRPRPEHASAAACRPRSKRPATPPTGSSSRPASRPPATRSR